MKAGAVSCRAGFVRQHDTHLARLVGGEQVHVRVDRPGGWSNIGELFS
jgi:hypothetical protein